MSQVDFDSHDAPVHVLAFFSCRCTCAMPPRWSTRHPLETGRRKKKGRTVIGPQSIKEKGEGRVSENDVMGVAVRPRPVGDRREWLLVEVCGREGWGTEEGVWLLSRPLLPDKTLSTGQHSGRTDGWMGQACSGDGGWVEGETEHKQAL